jgi:hypothetical protein
MITEIHRIVRDGQGQGGFLAPPGHPDHFYVVRSYYARPGATRISISSRREADGYSSLSSVLENEYGQYPESAVRSAQRIMDAAELTCSEAWVRSVYGYFRNSYSPDGEDRNVSRAISASGYHCACGEQSYSKGIVQLHVNWALTHMLRLRSRYTRKVSDFPAGPHHLVTPEFPPEHHLGYLCVKSYFPDHAARLDLIADPGQGYGSYPCVKCGTAVQYEAREDAYAEVLPGMRWRVSTECPAGGTHER